MAAEPPSKAPGLPWPVWPLSYLPVRAPTEHCMAGPAWVLTAIGHSCGVKSMPAASGQPLCSLEQTVFFPALPLCFLY